jgi:uncharacterized membrane protein YoaK (UPF0700 family)
MLATHSDVITVPIQHVPDTNFDSLTVAMLLTASGGFLDAFSYFGHGHVFANVMTANVVLSAVSCVHGDWMRVAQLLFPVVSYVAGALAGAMLKSWLQRRATANPQALAIGIGIAVLLAIGWLPAGFCDAAIVSIISFGIAIRSCFFSHVEAWTYASTMPTGNLRQLGEAIFQSLSGTGNPKAKRQAMVFGFISLSFFLGALAGGVATSILHNQAVWVGALFLLAALARGLFVRPASVATVRSSICVIGILALVSSTFARAQTEQDVAPACPGASTTLPVTTYDEDVQYLANRECHAGILTPMQFIPLKGEDENYYLSFGLWIRERGEYESNPNWSNKPSGNIYPMQRYLLHTDLHLGERFRFFGEIASSLENGRNGGPRVGIDEETFYVHQGFVDLGFWKSDRDSLTLRAGRQEVALGSQNLVSTRDGRNIRRSLDGARLTWVKGNWTVDLLAFHPVLDKPGYFDDPPDHGSSFWGAYSVRPLRVLPHGNADLYYMGLDNRSVRFDGKGTGREQRETIGTRLWGNTEHWDYNDEFTFQWGNFRSNDIRAWALSTDTGYRLDSAPLKPRFGLRAAALSGNQSPSGDTLGTFNSIYEQGPYFSYAELFARRNLIALQPSAALKLKKSVSLAFNPAFFWRESTSDGLYSVGNTVVVSGLKSNARYVATQASAQLRWRMTRNLSSFTEFSHFFPGDFIKQSTPGRNLNYWTAWLDIRY